MQLELNEKLQHDYQHMLIEDLQARRKSLFFLMIENILTEDPSATFLNSSKSDGRSVIRYFMIPSRIRFIPLRIVDLVLIFFSYI